MNDPENNDQEYFEDWAEEDIKAFMAIRFLHSLHGLFGDAYDAMKNPVWFINGRSEEILTNLRQKRQALEKYQTGIKDQKIQKLVEVSGKKLDEYVMQIETGLRDPRIMQLTSQVQKRVRGTAS